MGLIATVYKISTNGGYWMDWENYQHCYSAKSKFFLISYTKISTYVIYLN